MLNFFIATTALVLSATLGYAATQEELEGKVYCRTIETVGFMGQPAGQRKHCLSFAKENVKDNANTFFGNPPEVFSYEVLGQTVYFFEIKFNPLKNDKRKVHTDLSLAKSQYTLSSDLKLLATVIGSATPETVFTLVESF